MPSPDKEPAMPGHDIIVVGASAGGLEALQTLMKGLPYSLPAAEIAPILEHLTGQPAAEEEGYPVSTPLEIETRIALEENPP